MERRLEGACRHYRGEIHNDELVKTGEFGSPATIEIEQTESGVYLTLVDANGEYAGDLWFQSLEDALSGAREQFELSPEGWQTIKIDESDRHPADETDGTD